MTEPVARSVVEAFYEAYISRDPQRIGALLDDDVEWHVTGPAEVMQVCGHWQGKAAVIDRFERQVPKIIDFKSCISTTFWSTAITRPCSAVSPVCSGRRAV